MKRIILLIVLFGLAGLVRADSGQDLVNATNAFEKVKATMSNRVNTLQQEQRAAIWTQYYLALDSLQQMVIHQQMMVQHNEERNEQFGKAHSEFTHALADLLELLADPGKPQP